MILRAGLVYFYSEIFDIVLVLRDIPLEKYLQFLSCHEESFFSI